MIRFAPILAVLAVPALAETPYPPALQGLLDYHWSACTGQGGTLTIGPDAVQEAHLSGGDTPDLLLDSARLSCSTAPHMFCADGIGCELTVFVGQNELSLVVLDWSLEPDDDRQVLVVTKAGQLMNLPEDATFRLVWDSAAESLVAAGPAP